MTTSFAHANFRVVSPSRQDALALLKAAGGKNTLGELSLQAQILYREGQFSEVVAVLTRLVQARWQTNP